MTKTNFNKSKLKFPCVEWVLRLPRPPFSFVFSRTLFRYPFLWNVHTKSTSSLLRSHRRYLASCWVRFLSTIILLLFCSIQELLIPFGSNSFAAVGDLPFCSSACPFALLLLVEDSIVFLCKKARWWPMHQDN